MKQADLDKLWDKNALASMKRKGGISSAIHKKFADLDGPRRLFLLLEKWLAPLKSDGSQVIRTDRVDSKSIKALISEKKACAIHVPSFCSQTVSNALSQQAIDDFKRWKIADKIETDMFYAGGSIPREVASRSRPDFDRYFSERDQFIQRQRELASNAWPVDRLRLQLDEAWSHGAYLGEWLGEKMRPAMMRVMQSKEQMDLNSPKTGFIHTDDSPMLKADVGTFSANVYLKVPDEGGELYIWGVDFNQTEGIDSYLSAQLLNLAQNYVFDLEWQERFKKLLPEPHVIKPMDGDLVILHSGRPHAVAPFAKGARVTNQLFIFANGQAPLTIGS